MTKIRFKGTSYADFYAKVAVEFSPYRTRWVEHVQSMGILDKLYEDFRYRNFGDIVKEIRPDWMETHVFNPQECEEEHGYELLGVDLIFEDAGQEMLFRMKFGEYL